MGWDSAREPPAGKLLESCPWVEAAAVERMVIWGAERVGRPPGSERGRRALHPAAAADGSPVGTCLCYSPSQTHVRGSRSHRNTSPRSTATWKPTDPPVALRPPLCHGALLAPHLLSKVGLNVWVHLAPLSGTILPVPSTQNTFSRLTNPNSD